MLTMFCEGGKGSPVSMRRVLAFICSLSGIGLLFFGTAENNKFGTYGGIVCFIAAILLLVCTTLADIVKIIEAAKGMKV